MLLFLKVSNLNAQVESSDFLKTIKNFLKVSYDRNDLKILKKKSDSTDVKESAKGVYKWVQYLGKNKFIDNLFVDFDITVINYTKNLDKRTTGKLTFLTVSDDLNSVKYLESQIDKMKSNLIGYNIILDSSSTSTKKVITFDNFSPKTMFAFKSIGYEMRSLLYSEYLDFYYCDINIKTSSWKIERKYFEPPYSTILIKLVKKKSIKNILSLIELKNEGFSWNLAEGLWYYNSIYNILNKEQLKIVERYNGRNEMITFRTKEELAKIYKFK